MSLLELQMASVQKHHSFGMGGQRTVLVRKSEIVFVVEWPKVIWPNSIPPTNCFFLKDVVKVIC